jgi:hypothetical protein
VVFIQALQPNKTDVLACLNGIADVPPRWAHVVVAQGSADEARGELYVTISILPTEFLQLNQKNSRLDHYNQNQYSVYYLWITHTILEEIMSSTYLQAHRSYRSGQ